MGQTKGEVDAQSDLVMQVVALYESGKLDEAEHLALKTLDAPGDLGRPELSELYVILAFCAIASDDEENSRRHFVSALKYNPNLKPDPIGWSPKVRQVFERARTEWIQITELAALSEVSLEAEFCRRASYNSLILPGSGQITKGHVLSGWIQGVVFWGGLATAIYANSEVPGLRDKYRAALYPDDIKSSYKSYQIMSRLAIISTSVTISFYGYSAFDALTRKPEADVMARGVQGK